MACGRVKKPAPLSRGRMQNRSRASEAKRKVRRNEGASARARGHAPIDSRQPAIKIWSAKMVGPHKMAALAAAATWIRNVMREREREADGEWIRNRYILAWVRAPRRPVADYHRRARPRTRLMRAMRGAVFLCARAHTPSTSARAACSFAYKCSQGILKTLARVRSRFSFFLRSLYMCV